jgi:8-amino-7-oxononanoate synthase
VTFCSNDYLGLASRLAPAHPAGAGGSRLVSGEREEHLRLERAAADYVGLPAALAFSSGYAANLGLMSALAGPGDLVVSDALNHASIIDGIRLSRARVAIVPHCAPEAIERALGERGGARAFVVTESYFSMDADSPDLAALRMICDAVGAALIVDEAHALGVLGPQGKGLCARAGIQPDALVGTFGKAFGAAGAFVAGCPSLISWLWNRARPFVFSTGLSPAVAAAAHAGLRAAAEEPDRRARVLAGAIRFRRALEALGVQALGQGPIIPWVVGDESRALRVAKGLLDRGIDARAIRPPSVSDGTSRIRFTITANHTDDDIDRAAGAVAAVLADGATWGS